VDVIREYSMRPAVGGGARKIGMDRWRDGGSGREG
jgi:hypothetical protein